MPTILAQDAAHSRQLARQLLDAAGDCPELVKVITSGTTVAFDVPDELLEAISQPDKPAAPKKAPAKKAPAKAPAKTED